MEPNSCVLTQDLIYDAAEISNKSTPLESIKCITLTDRYTDLSILNELKNLRIISFRLCSLNSFPEDLFQIKSLQIIDLSGNQISALPEHEKFSSLVNLCQLNLGDNDISDINEISKLDLLPSLSQLVLTGNSCLATKDSFDLITSWFPKLILLNGSIITSQYRAFLQSFTNSNENSIIPLSKADDYIFIYAKYIRASAIERNYRRSMAQTFCISKVIRHLSAAHKIQSVYRGFRQKNKYIQLKQSTKYLFNFFQFWVHKRIKAASKIRSIFLHFQMRQKIKEVASARKIQSVFRSYLVRRLCLTSVFEKDDKFVFYITSSNLRRLKAFLTKGNFPFPDEELPSSFRKIRLTSPKKQRLPGSPVIFYTIDNSALIRPLKVKKPLPYSIWCNHNHNCRKMDVRVSKYGVNYCPACLLSVITFTPYTKTIKPFKPPSYETLICCVYKDKSVFNSIVSLLCKEESHRIRLFPEKTVTTISALLVVQSSFRTFLVRSRTFKKVKQEALEKRSARCIKHFIHSTFFKASITHSLDVLHFFRSLPNTNIFYITKTKLDKIFLARVATKYKVNFGYSADRFVLIQPGAMQLPMLFVPTGRLVFGDQDVSSLFKFGVATAKVSASMLEQHVPSKWLRRNRIVRLTFANAEEARLRISLYVYLTRDFGGVMQESDVIRFCAANSIRNAWIGFIMRKTITHIGMQAGKKLNLRCLIRHNIAEKRRKRVKVERDDGSYEYEYEDEDDFLRSKRSTMNFDKNDRSLVEAALLGRRDLPPQTAIDILRFDRRSWKADFEHYKEERAYEDSYNSGGEERVAAREQPTQSMLGLGLVDELENAFARTNPIEKQEIKTMGFDAMKKSDLARRIAAVAPIKKPLVASLRFPKKPLKFEIEVETQKIFAPSLHQTVSRLPRGSGLSLAAILSRSAAATLPAPLPPLRHPNTPTECSQSQSQWPEELTASEQQSDEESELKNIEEVKSEEENELKSDEIKSEIIEEVKSEMINGDGGSGGDVKCVKSAQRSDDSVRRAMLAAFSKLVRLRQLGMEIEEAAAVDKVKVANAMKASETRASITTMRAAAAREKEEDTEQLRKRNAVEKRELAAERSELATRAAHSRARKAQKMKSEHARQMEKSRADRQAARQIISISKLAGDSEKAHQKSEKKRKANLIGLSSEKVRESSNESKMKFKEAFAQMQMRKQQAALWDKQLSSQKEEEVKMAHTEKVNRVCSIREKELIALKKRSRMNLVKEKVDVKGDLKPDIVEDEIENAAGSIGNYIGANLGDIESHLLTNMINEILLSSS